MLLQRPINMRELGLANVLSREETAYMREMASQRFDSIMQVLKSMPRPMLLVFRNINTVRSINISLGAPVDRYFIMAKRSVPKRFTRPVLVSGHGFLWVAALLKIPATALQTRLIGADSVMLLSRVSQELTRTSFCVA